jgi:hypothetical protein
MLKYITRAAGEKVAANDDDIWPEPLPVLMGTKLAANEANRLGIFFPFSFHKHLTVSGSVGIKIKKVHLKMIKSASVECIDLFWSIRYPRVLKIEYTTEKTKHCTRSPETADDRPPIPLSHEQSRKEWKRKGEKSGERNIELNSGTHARTHPRGGYLHPSMLGKHEWSNWENT